MLNDLELQYPGAKRKLISWYMSYKQKVEEIGFEGVCNQCGNPSSQDVCNACRYMKKIRTLVSS